MVEADPRQALRSDAQQVVADHELARQLQAEEEGLVRRLKELRSRGANRGRSSTEKRERRGSAAVPRDLDDKEKKRDGLFEQFQEWSRREKVRKEEGQKEEEKLEDRLKTSFAMILAWSC